MTNNKTELEINKQYDIENVGDVVNFANHLKTVVVDKGLYSNIKGKNYVNVEGWQFAGLSLGVVPIITKVEPTLIDSTGKVSYRAEVELRRLKDDKQVGFGVAICSPDERSDRKDEYAIAAMAQTRAISRAYRNTFGWIMKMAGYEVTPAEEADIEKDVREKAKDELDELRAKN